VKTSIATVRISGNIHDKLEAIAAAGFRAVEIFENDLIAYPGSPYRRGWPDRRQCPQNDRSRDITGRTILKPHAGSAHPAYLDQGYRSPALRGPTKPLIPIRGVSLAALVYGHDRITATDADLTRNGARVSSQMA
jgi:hypothetical protein